MRDLAHVGDPVQFQLFVRALAARSAQLLNLSELARDIGVAVNTAKRWLGVLEATYQVIVLRPYFANVSKRMVKTPKVYFSDTGLLCHLVGLSQAGHAAQGPMAGAIFETAVVAELTKAALHHGGSPRLYFSRTSAGMEVDLLIERGGEVVPLEIKLNATPRPTHAASIRRLRADLGATVAPGFVIHPGASTLPLGEGARALPFWAL